MASKAITSHLMATILVLLGSITSAVAQTATQVKVCVKVPVTMSDEEDAMPRVMEDFGRDGDWKARGIRLDVHHYPKGPLMCLYNGPPDFTLSGSDYADGDGCSAEFDLDQINTPNTCWQIKLHSKGEIHTGSLTNKLKVRGAAGNIEEQVLNIDNADLQVSNEFAAPKETAAFRVYAILAWIMQERYLAGIDDEVFNAYIFGKKDRLDTKCPCSCAKKVDGGSCACADDSEFHMCLSQASNAKKYVIAHEYGHANLRAHLPDGFDKSCSAYRRPGDGEGYHYLTSVEQQSCAFFEGFGHFVAVSAYNRITEEDAFFHYYKKREVLLAGGGTQVEDKPWVGVNTPVPGSPFIKGYFRNRVIVEDSTFDPSDADEKSTELDWMRFLWDYITNQSHPSVAPDQEQIKDEIEAGVDFQRDNTYHAIWRGVRDFSGGGVIRYQELAPINDVCWNCAPTP